MVRRYSVVPSMYDPHEAASTIQRAYRYHAAKMRGDDVEAARLLAMRAIRGFGLARFSRVKARTNITGVSANTLRRSARRAIHTIATLGKKKRSASVLQRWWRGAAFVVRVKRRVQRNKKRREMLARRDDFIAARIIQTCWRCFKAKKIVSNMLVEKREAEINADARFRTPLDAALRLQVCLCVVHSGIGLLEDMRTCPYNFTRMHSHRWRGDRTSSFAN